MKYEVVKTFADLQDNRHLYNVGDTFPHEGAEVSEDRLKELSGSSNKLGTPLIKEVIPKSKTTKKKKVEEGAD
jgi:hypothetical protein